MQEIIQRASDLDWMGEAAYMAIDKLNSAVRPNVIQSRNERKKRQPQKLKKPPPKKTSGGRVDERA